MHRREAAHVWGALTGSHSSTPSLVVADVIQHTGPTMYTHTRRELSTTSREQFADRPASLITPMTTQIGFRLSS